MRGGSIVLIGHDGMVGRAYGGLLGANGVSYRGLSFPDFDLADPAAIERVVTLDVGLVINCAAWTDVDGAEEHEREAAAINGGGAGHLAVCCRRVGALLVHYSTDYVFNGNALSPYSTDHPRAPINAYGRTKALGEELIEASGCECLIVRTSWAYASWGKNFVRTIARLAAERDSIKVIDDQHGRPTSVEHLVETTHRIVAGGGRGVFHVTDGGECSWFELAQEVVGGLGLTCHVAPCTTDDFPLPAQRPVYSTLDLTKTEAFLKVALPGWRENLAPVLDCLAAERSGSGG